MSSTLESMLRTRLGYRTETYSGSGVRDLRAVLRHELSVLGNTDVLVYCNQHYAAGFGVFYGKAFLNSVKTNPEYYTKRVEHLVRKRLGARRSLFALWLTTPDNVHRIYGGTEGEIACYVIPQNTMILSDLGPDGSLFVYEKHPRQYLKGNKTWGKNVALKLTGTFSTFSTLWKHRFRR